MPRRPHVTRSGLLSEAYGERPHVVRLREEKQPGTNVVLDYRLRDRRRKESLGYRVRRRDGKRWRWDNSRLQRARESAQRRSAELHLNRLRDDVQPTDLTVADAWELFHDEERGGLPPSRSLRSAHIRAARFWRRWFKPDTQWNRIRRADVDAAMRHFAEQTSPRTHKPMIPTGLRCVEILRTCHRWLEDKQGIDDLRDPTKGFDFSAWRRRHKPSRPRYTDEEAEALLRVRHDVDPRFSLFLVLMEDSGARGKAVRLLWRSMVDCALDQEPTDEQAPYGWLVFPALKGQEPVLHFLTAFERRELELALAGYLREMEAIWRGEEGKDYPLFPSIRTESLSRGRPVRPGQSRAYLAVTANAPKLWLLQAERAAGVTHVEGRGYHGFRRRVADYLLAETDLKALTVAGGWSSQRTPEQIYVEKRRHPDRARAREAMERKRRGE